MKHYFGILIVITFVLIAGIIGCSDTEKPVVAGTSDEESTVQLTLTDTYDSVRNGAHLIMSYDVATNSFRGTVENNTGAILPQVRVEVHLSNGVELGPTSPVDLAPGAQIPVELMAEGPSFDKWTAHPEVGVSGAESGSENGGEGSGEAGGGESGGEHGQGSGHN